MSDYQFKGSIKECVAHLREGLKNQPEKWEEVLEVFSHVKNERKVKRWIKGEFSPLGQSLIYFRYRFEAMGYQVEELSKLPKEVFLFGKETFGKGMKIEEILSLLGPAFNAGMVYAYYLEGIIPPVLKLDIMREIYEKKPADTANATIAINPCEGSESVAMKKSTVADYFCHLIKMLTPLVEALISDDFLPADRRKIREELGRNEFFRISVLIDGLSSEESRAQVLKSLNSQLQIQKGAK